MRNLEDSLSPEFLFSLTDTELLVSILNRSIDSIELARNELQKRGCDENGIWVGFKNQKRFSKHLIKLSKPFYFY